MALVEISSIQDSNLKKAAERADSGNTRFSYNGKLDISEIGTFLKSAELLNCDYYAVYSVIDSYNYVKPTNLVNKIKLYEQIDNKKKQIEKLKSELSNLPINGTKEVGTIMGAGLGAAGGIYTMGCLVSSVNPLVGLCVIGVSALIGGVAGNAIGEGVSSHEARCADAQRKSLKEQIQKREQELEQLRQEFLNLYGTNTPKVIY